MNMKWCVMFFAVALFLCPLSMPVHAQTGSNCSGPFYCSWYSFSSGCMRITSSKCL